MNTISVFKECSLGVKTDVKGEPCNAAGEVSDQGKGRVMEAQRW